MKTSTVTTAGGLTLALLAATVLSAQPVGPEGPGPRPPHVGPGAPPEAMARLLGLSEQQTGELRAILEEQRPVREAHQKKMRENRKRLEEALEGGADATTVGEIAIEGHRLREQGRSLHEAADEAIRALLTKEQLAKFDAMRALRAEGGPRGPFGPGGPGMRPPRAGCPQP